MKSYWEELIGPRPGLIIREVRTELDNVYIKDEYGRIFQIWIEHDGPLLQLAGQEDVG